MGCEGVTVWGKGSETAEEAMQRRLRESQRVEERVIQVRDGKEFGDQVLKVGGVFLLCFERCMIV